MIDTIIISQGEDGKRQIAISGDILDVVLATTWQEAEDISVFRGNKKPSAFLAEGFVFWLRGPDLN